MEWIRSRKIPPYPAPSPKPRLSIQPPFFPPHRSRRNWRRSSNLRITARCLSATVRSRTQPLPQTIHLPRTSPHTRPRHCVRQLRKNPPLRPHPSLTRRRTLDQRRRRRPHQNGSRCTRPHSACSRNPHRRSPHPLAHPRPLRPASPRRRLGARLRRSRLAQHHPRARPPLVHGHHRRPHHPRLRSQNRRPLPRLLAARPRRHLPLAQRSQRRQRRRTRRPPPHHGHRRRPPRLRRRNRDGGRHRPLPHPLRTHHAPHRPHLRRERLLLRLRPQHQRDHPHRHRLPHRNVPHRRRPPLLRHRRRLDRRHSEVARHGQARRPDQAAHRPPRPLDSPPRSPAQLLPQPPPSRRPLRRKENAPPK